MALLRSDAFVLRTYKLGEVDQIVVFFTRELGKIRAVVRRSHSLRRHIASLCQPLMHLHVIVFARPQQALFRVNSVEVVESFRSLREDFTALRSGLYLTELLDVTTHECEPLPELFELFQTTLAQLARAPTAPFLMRRFEVRLLALIGYAPQLATCVRCARPLQPQDRTFSPALGGLLCTACAATAPQPLRVTPATLAALRALAADEAPLPPGDTATERELERLLHAHLVARLGRELKSYPFLHL
ncbi:MAG: hypothetical protein KatS3mg131_1021 [Candidatus Tectimicrobiota bacterium]|nr:MAG: hypothetical protein KatS3mg131_1021 [Candidatus Tectomicrobia bacterium]